LWDRREGADWARSGGARRKISVDRRPGSDGPIGPISQLSFLGETSNSARIRGHVPAPAMGTQWSSLVEASVGRHSEKPAAFYEKIEAYFPTLPKIELHARGVVPRAGWDVWGLEAPAQTETGRALALTSRCGPEGSQAQLPFPMRRRQTRSPPDELDVLRPAQITQVHARCGAEGW
jgi:hypothetical protein